MNASRNLSRHEFIRFTGLSAIAAVTIPRLAAARPAIGDTEDIFDLLRARESLALASDSGAPMIKSFLGIGSESEITLSGKNGAFTRHGLAVANGEVLVGARSLPEIGNRSTYARVGFAFESPRSTLELQLVTTHKPIQGRMLHPLRARLSGGTFVLLGLDNELIAGDRNKVVFTPRPGEWHTLELVTFQKSVHARISGCDAVLTLPDKLRFIPGDPGLLLAPVPGSKVHARDWLVTAIGPRPAVLGAIGDSITAGWQVGPEVEDYVHIVTQGLGQKYVLNTGSGGATTGQDRARFAYEIAPFRPHLVWIESGTNDLAQGLDAVRIHANQLATAAQINWGGKAVLSTVLPRNGLRPAEQEERRKLNALIRQSGFPFVDRARICETPGKTWQLRPDFDHGDGVHPNAQGARAIAEAALPIFRRLV